MTAAAIATEDLEIPRCTAHTSAGRQCKQRPIRGGTVCATHGGKAPQVREAASFRLLQASVNGELRRQGWEPVTDPIAFYADLGGEVLAFKDLCRARVNELEGKWENPTLGMIAEDTRAAVQLYERALDRADKILASMLRIGLDAAALRQGRERSSREQAETLSQVIAKVLSDPRVTVEPGAANAVVLDALKGLGS